MPLDMSRVSRRTLLRGLGVGLLALGGVATFIRTSGYDLPAHRRGKLRVLDAAQFTILTAIASCVCAADGSDAPSIEETDVVGFVDTFAVSMPGRMRRDLLLFLGVIEHVAPLFAKHATRFTLLPKASQDDVLSALEVHDNGLLRGGFAGLKALLFMGYYRDPKTWSLLNYDGPTIGRAVTP